MQESLEIKQPLMTNLDTKMSSGIFFVVIILGIWIFTDVFKLITFEVVNYLENEDAVLYLSKTLFLLIKLIAFFLLLKLKAIGFLLTMLIVLLQVSLLFLQLEPNNILQLIILVSVTLIMLFFLGKKYYLTRKKTR